MKRFVFLLIITLLLNSITFSQTVSTVDSLDSNYLNWFNMDPTIDKIQGVSVERAYSEILKNKVAKKKIIVAVIDAGIDINHEDLQGKIWTNTKEIPDNGIDDDNNGYIDDIHGWNFIGNSKGENIVYENTEEVRIYRNLKPKYENTKSEEEVKDEDKAEYKTYLTCKKEYDDNLKRYKRQDGYYKHFEKRLAESEDQIKLYLNKTEFVYSDLKTINTENEDVMKARSFLMNIYRNGFTHEDLKKEKEHNSEYLDKHFNIDFEPRKIIGDSTENINDNNYGNNDVKCTRSEHGTFVAGIIGANRNNGIGINGIAENIEIMVLRTVPSGDERDKDVALSIRYAVDNGANIINMSFGKNYSPEKKFVDEALKYADEHNVLLVHAAGNSAIDVDKIERFPTNNYYDGTKTQNWINVGANSKKADKNLCGIFSNYGLTNVDLFAPGVNVISLFPESKYSMNNGTSFSSPVVSGVAALIWSYYPELSASELKEILINSSYKLPKLKVYSPNLSSSKRKKVKFNMLSKTGGIVNAYEALKLAENFSSKK